MAQSDQDERLHRTVAWVCKTDGPQSILVDGDSRPHCAVCGEPMLAVPYLREFDVNRETATMKDALYQIGYCGAHPVATAKRGLGDLENPNGTRTSA